MAEQTESLQERHRVTLSGVADYVVHRAEERGRKNDDQVALIKSSVANIVREFEQRRELEKKAEELQSRDGAGEDDVEEEKRMRVRKELEKVAKEQAERRATILLMFDLGQKAYGRGMYGRAIEFLEGALTIIPRPTLFGGEILIWMDMAYKNLLFVAYKNVIGSL
ncbi:hypothetical protein SESBI_29802 [Sesbania bispinosa]|nr:hypothetical protein SESBI_29802 [Sesbania bispinosa]